MSCPLAKDNRDPGLFLCASASIERQPSTAITYIQRALVLWYKHLTPDFNQTIGNVSGNVINQLRNAGIFLIDVFEILRLNQCVNTVDVILIKKREAFLAMVILILEESHFIAGVALSDIVQEFIVEEVRPVGKKGIVQHQGIETHLLE